MKKWVILSVMLASLLVSCAVPAATLPTTSIPTAATQPSATPTATPLPTATPEPTTPPEAFVVQADGTLGQWNEDKGAYETVCDAVAFKTDAATGRATCLDGDDQPTGVYDTETGETYLVSNGQVTLADEKTYAWDGAAWVEAVPTPIPTPTPEPTATLTPTATPEATTTPEPTATTTFEPMVIYGGNSENIQKFTRITVEDVKSGRLADAMRVRIKPFPAEAFLSEMHVQAEPHDPGGFYLAGPSLVAQYRFESRTRPQRWLSYWKININGEDWIGGSLQMLNADGSSSIVNGLVISYEDYNRRPKDSLLTRTFQNQLQILLLHRFNKDCNEVWGSFVDVCALYQNDADAQSVLVGQWLSSGVIPLKLEQLLVGFRTSTW